MPRANLTRDVSPQGHKLECSGCLLPSHGSVAKVFVPHGKDSRVPFSE